MMNEISEEIIEKKKIEIINCLGEHFDIVAMTGRNDKYHSYDLVAEGFVENYKALNWLADPSVWIRLISIDENKRGKGFAIHIKCKVENWTGGRSSVDKKYFIKWNFPLGDRNFHFRVAHGNELIFSVLHDEVKNFEPTESYFMNYLNHTFNLYYNNLLEVENEDKKILEESVKNEVDNKVTEKTFNMQSNQSSYEEPIYSTNDENEDEVEFQKKVERMPNPPRGLKIHYVAKEKSNKPFRKVYEAQQKRNPEVAKNALAASSYLCEIDKNHESFISRVSNEKYAEAHHLIPFQAINNFYMSIDVEANVISLCPNCHRKLHHGLFEEIEPLLKRLYNERMQVLNDCKIGLSYELLQSYYQ
ncbi:putative HNH restriction endonuclease [Planomicrobium sp. HSC-17F08]|nr:putative HNH restriction endonuclease [Planomicrobium sp. HSC-17F08]